MLDLTKNKLIMLAHVKENWKSDKDLMPTCCHDAPFWHTHKLKRMPESLPCNEQGCEGVLKFFKQIVGETFSAYAEPMGCYMNEFLCTKCGVEHGVKFVVKLEACKG
jgi:hypothetical protein